MSKNTNKIELDKYYTPVNLAIELIEQTLDFIGRDNIDTIIEPSSGNGSFSNYLFDKYSSKYKILAYDIEPEESRIIKQDFLKLDLEYNDRCLIIGNPPFGKTGGVASQFYKKSCTISKYIAFILSTNHYNNDISLYLYDLVYSTILTNIQYSDRLINTCFNIYKRPVNNINNKYNQYKLNNIKLYNTPDRLPKKDGVEWLYNITDYDLIMGWWGNLNVFYENNSMKNTVIKIKIDIENIELKNKIIQFIKDFDWLSYKKDKTISVPFLSKNDIWKVIGQQFPELRENKEYLNNLFKF